MYVVKRGLSSKNSIQETDREGVAINRKSKLGDERERGKGRARARQTSLLAIYPYLDVPPLRPPGAPPPGIDDIRCRFP